MRTVYSGHSMHATALPPACKTLPFLSRKPGLERPNFLLGDSSAGRAWEGMFGVWASVSLPALLFMNQPLVLIPLGGTHPTSQEPDRIAPAQSGARALRCRLSLSLSKHPLSPHHQALAS